MEDQAEQMDKPKNRGRMAALQDEHLDVLIDISLNNETFKTKLIFHNTKPSSKMQLYLAQLQLTASTQT